MKNSKKVKSVVMLLLIMTFTFLTVVPAFADADAFESQDGKWLIEHSWSETGEMREGVAIFGYLGDETDVVIPETFRLYWESGDETEYPVEMVDDLSGQGEYSESASKIEKLTIPSTVTKINFETAFLECANLKEIVILRGNNNYASEDGVLFNNDKTELCYFPNAKSVETYTVPDGVKSIGVSKNEYVDCSFTFSDKNFKNIVIPESVTTIAPGVFDDCENVTIYAASGSYAEAFAKENKIAFVADELPEVPTKPEVPTEKPEVPSETPDKEDGKNPAIPNTTGESAKLITFAVASLVVISGTCGVAVVSKKKRTTK